MFSLSKKDELAKFIIQQTVVVQIKNPAINCGIEFFNGIA